MQHITLIAPSLNSGGAERAVLLLAEGFVNKCYQVSLITVHGQDSYFYKVPDGVNIIALNIGKKSPTLVHSIFNNFYRLWVMRRAIISIKPDIVISVLDTTNILTLLALINTKYPVFVNEQNNPGVSTGNIWKYLRRFSYPFAKKVVSTSRGVDEYFSWLPKKQRAVIYNPLAGDINHDYGDVIDLLPGADPDKKWIIAMGRLTEQKGFDILLDAFHKIAYDYPDWQLLILGEGELRSELERKRDDLGLNNQVIFPGRVDNPFPILKRSEMFVLSSRYEGFGNVIIEAMACALPVISTDCPSGPGEIIRNGIDGILVPNKDVSSLSAAIVELICDQQKRQSLSENALKAVKRFELPTIVEYWEDLMAE